MKKTIVVPFFAVCAVIFLYAAEARCQTIRYPYSYYGTNDPSNNAWVTINTSEHVLIGSEGTYLPQGGMPGASLIYGLDEHCIRMERDITTMETWTPRGNMDRRRMSRPAIFPRPVLFLLPWLSLP